MSDIMTPRPAVSVVMPAYNLAKFVGQSIESVLSQTYGDFELVIIDNGSTDNTADVIRSYKDERIKFLKVPSNLGPSLAVNIAIGHSTGKYVALLAADDYWTPEKLARQTAYLDSHPDTGAVFSLASVVDEEGIYFLTTSMCMAGFSSSRTARGTNGWCIFTSMEIACVRCLRWSGDPWWRAIGIARRCSSCPILSYGFGSC